ncbi:MAG: hypothetical protein AAF899_18185, partial [Pseudomonadota bacterium]
MTAGCPPADEEAVPCRHSRRAATAGMEGGRMRIAYFLNTYPTTSQTFDYQKHILNLQYNYSINKNWDVSIEYSHTRDFDGLRR